MIQAEVGDNLILSVASQDGTAGLFPLARVFDSAGVIVGVAHAITDLGLGLYSSTLVAPAAGYYTVLFTFYDDSGHTTMSSGQPQVQKDVKVSAAPGIAQLNVAYDDTTKRVYLEAWLERKGEIVTSPTSAAVVIKDKGGGTLVSASTASFGANGVANMEAPSIVFADNRPYNATVTLVDSLGTVVTVHSITTVA